MDNSSNMTVNTTQITNQINPEHHYGLDKNKAEDMRTLFKRLKKEGKAILLASHNSKDISELCDEVMELECNN